jgi:hypothetical protein
MTDFKPYANESDEQEIGHLKIENRLDKISFYGDLDITRDQTGLANARSLKMLVDRIVSALEDQDLPEKLSAPAIKKVKNPF